MAKRGAGSPARKRARMPEGENNESLLIESAESLGRLIRALQRELDRTARQIAGTAAKTKATKSKKTRPSKRASPRTAITNRAKKR